jgi:hypothetical protein
MESQRLELYHSRGQSEVVGGIDDSFFDPRNEVTSISLFNIVVACLNESLLSFADMALPRGFFKDALSRQGRSFEEATLASYHLDPYYAPIVKAAAGLLRFGAGVKDAVWQKVARAEQGFRNPDDPTPCKRKEGPR